MAFLGGRSDFNLQECWRGDRDAQGFQGAVGTRGPGNPDGKPAGKYGQIPRFRDGSTHRRKPPKGGGEGSTPGFCSRGRSPEQLAAGSLLTKQSEQSSQSRVANPERP